MFNLTLGVVGRCEERCGEGLDANLRLCEQSVRRKGYVYIICSKNPKHKQRQG